MPTIIDSLVVRLGFDTSSMKAGRAEAATQLQQTRAEAGRTAASMEAEGARAAQFFTQIKTEALSLLGVFLGGRTLEAFVNSTTTSLAALGREAKNIGIAVPDLAAFRNMIERNGGSADAAAASFLNLTNEMEKFKVFGQSSLIPFLNPIGGQRGDTALQIWNKFVAFAEKNKNDVPLINLIGQGLGFPQAAVNQAQKGVRQNAADFARSSELGLPTKEMTENFAKLQEGLVGLEQATNNLATVLLNEIAPGLTAMSISIATWIGKLPKTAEDTSKAVTDAMRRQAEYQEQHPTPASPANVEVKSAVEKFFDWLKGLAERTGDGDMQEARRRAAGGTGAGGSSDGYIKRLNNWVGRRLGYEPDPEGGYRRVGSGGASTRGDAAAQESLQFWKDKGLTPSQAAGMAAQEQAESQGDPNARGDYNKSGVAEAHGAYQWHADRRRRILAGTGIDVSNATIRQQREAAYWELMNVEHEARRRVLAAKTPEEAGQASTEFERPDPNRRAIIDIERGRLAARILQKAAGPRVAAEPAKPSAPGTGYRLLNRDDLAPSSYDPSLLPRPGASLLRPETNTDASTSVQIDRIEVNTRATDAKGIGADINRSLTDAIITQANRGLQ